MTFSVNIRKLLTEKWNRQIMGKLKRVILSSLGAGALPVATLLTMLSGVSNPGGATTAGAGHLLLFKLSNYAFFYFLILPNL